METIESDTWIGSHFSNEPLLLDDESFTNAYINIIEGLKIRRLNDDSIFSLTEV